MIDLQEKILLRPAAEQDIPFMRELYLSTRLGEQAESGLPDGLFKHFLAVQFAAQYQHYISYYNSSDFNIVDLDGAPIGRFFVDHMKAEIRIVDITLLPQLRGQGIGSYLFGLTFRQARARNCPVTIHVDRDNPARRLYERLGFKVKAERDEVYLLMEWRNESCG